MKTEKITVNKTPEQPDGVEIEIVQPESKLEGQLLSYLVTSHLKFLKQDGRFTEKLPDNFNVDHRGQGTFVINRMVTDGQYYEQPRPVAIVGIRTMGNRFDLVHAMLPEPTAAAAAAGPATVSRDAAAQAPMDAAPLTGTTDTGEPMIFNGADKAPADDSDVATGADGAGGGADASAAEKERSRSGRATKKSDKSKSDD